MHRQKRSSQLTIAHVVILVAAIAGPSTGTGTPAGTVIDCLSSATYTNGEGTLNGQVSSNTVTLTVGQKAGVSMTPTAMTEDTTPGGRIYVPVNLQNTGNAPDNFTISGNAPAGWAVVFYRDTNGDGVRQLGENTVVTNTGSLTGSGVAKLLMEVSLPESEPITGLSKNVQISTASAFDTSKTASGVVSVTALDLPTQLSVATIPEVPQLGQAFDVEISVIPEKQTSVELRLLKPDGSVAVQELNTDYNGVAVATINGDISGQWVVTAEWDAPGSAPNVVQALNMKCQGPYYDVYGLEMLTVPLQLINDDPSTIANLENSLALTRWAPELNSFLSFDPYSGWSDAGFDSIDPGQAFWAWSPESVRVEPVGRLVNQNQPFSYTLVPGWHQIGSPFLQPVNWSDVGVVYNNTTYTVGEAKAANLILDYAWTFEKVDIQSGYALVHNTAVGARRTVDPWKGYWIYANQPVQFVLNPSGDMGLQSQSHQAGLASSETNGKMMAQGGGDEPQRRRRRRGSPGTNPDPNEWLVTIGAYSSKAYDADNSFGISQDDSLRNIVNPPKARDYVDLYFVAENSKQYASDVRKEAGVNEVFSFAIETSDPGLVHTINWMDMDEAPDGYKLMLVDLQTNTTVDLSATSIYQYTPQSNGQPDQFEIRLDRSWQRN